MDSNSSPAKVKQLSPVTIRENFKDHNKIEDIVLRYSGRGMTRLREYLGSAYCEKAARRLLSLERGTVFLTTGFYVAGHAETDGPPGALIIALALKKLGFTPIIVTDRVCDGLFEPEGIFVLYVGIQANAAWYQSLLDHFHPVCLISIERCGRNQNQDYANMKGTSISAQTAHIDTMFELASDAHIFTIGIGDGGNEIGMGNLKNVISEKLSLTPCEITVDELIIATTSNWGAYALVAYLDLLQEQSVFPSYEEISGFLRQIVALGCVDGVTKQNTPSVDGFPSETEQEIIDLLHQITDPEPQARPAPDPAQPLRR
ncbi:MAG: DUF4392 domain-containing protein [Lachnospiraceae bacterium]|nr:DUF4392 domain-containing protein [Lachnospiraceae bacterium]